MQICVQLTIADELEPLWSNLENETVSILTQYCKILFPEYVLYDSQLLPHTIFAQHR